MHALFLVVSRPPRTTKGKRRAQARSSRSTERPYWHFRRARIAGLRRLRAVDTSVPRPAARRGIGSRDAYSTLTAPWGAAQEVARGERIETQSVRKRGHVDERLSVRGYRRRRFRRLPRARPRRRSRSHHPHPRSLAMSCRRRCLVRSGCRRTFPQIHDPHPPDVAKGGFAPAEQARRPHPPARIPATTSSASKRRGFCVFFIGQDGNLRCGSTPTATEQSGYRSTP